jgi:hypothetical protein
VPVGRYVDSFSARNYVRAGAELQGAAANSVAVLFVRDQHRAWRPQELGAGSRAIVCRCLSHIRWIMELPLVAGVRLSARGARP